MPTTSSRIASSAYPKQLEGARAQLRTGTVSVLQVEAELRRGGIPEADVEQLGRELRLEAASERIGGPGARERLAAVAQGLGGVDDSVAFCLKRMTGPRSSWFAVQTPGTPVTALEPAQRAAELVRYSTAGRSLRKDLLLTRSAAELGALGARAQHSLASQSFRAQGRLDATAALLNVDRSVLDRAIERTLLTPKRADELIAARYGSHVNQGGVRAQETLECVTPEAFLAAYEVGQAKGRSLLGQALRAMLAKLGPERDVPSNVPAVELNGKVLLPVSAASSGGRQVGVESILLHRHPDADAAIGPGLVRALSERLVSGLFDGVAALSAEGRGARKNLPLELHGVLAELWFERDPGDGTGRGAELQPLEEQLGRDALAHGFFRDPQALAAQIEEGFGNGTTARLDQLLTFEPTPSSVAGLDAVFGQAARGAGTRS
jgi:hypothetical protein